MNANTAMNNPPALHPLLKTLNPEQAAAASADAYGSTLVLAGAGSGKTRVLTTRIAWLIQTGQASPQGILAVTFTNKASKEMLLRISAQLPINLRGMWMGTFHGLCNRFLRTHYKDANLPQTFQILDSADQLSAIKRAYKASGIDDEKFPPKQAANFINNAKENALRPDDCEVNDHYNKKYVQIYTEYQAQCTREGVVDFAELLLRCYEILVRNAGLRAHYQARFRHILVDEFQDTNRLQYLWLKILAGVGEYASEHIAPAATLAVGDDDQSIYAFRGAKVGNMYDFEREFGVKNTVKLEQNYRSSSHILDCANTLIAHNEKRLGKNLWTAAGEGEPVRVFEAPSDLDEARFIVEDIQEQLRRGTAAVEIAILYRSNAQSRVLEHALFQAGIPYRVYGGLRFFERAEIKTALAYLRLMENPHDDGAFLRVVNFPTRGIGAKSIENLGDAAKMHDRSLFGSVQFVAGKAGSSLHGFANLIETLRFETQGLPLAELVEHVIARTGLITYYENEKDGKNDNADRIENLRELVSAAAAFLGQEGYAMDASSTQTETVTAPTVDVETGELSSIIASPLAGFLSHATLEAGDNQALAGQAAVQMMTVHAAKGLEFDVVYVGGLEEGLFPHENSTMVEDGVEEERRLMYVAITRARARLHLTFAATRMLHGQTRYSLRSRFFDELPEPHLKWLSPKTRGWNPQFTKVVAQAYDEMNQDTESYSRAWKDSADTGGGARQIAQALAKKAADREAARANNQAAIYGTNMAAVYAAQGLAGKTISNAIGNALAFKGISMGSRVRHGKFGDGVVLTLEGSGTDARAQINFRAVGTKWLALGVAKLEVI